MIKILLGLMLALMSMNAIAKWTYVGDAGTFRAYADIKTIHKERVNVTMWSVFDFKSTQNIKGKSFLSIKRLQEYDCKGNQLMAHVFTARTGAMGTGVSVYKEAQINAYNPVVMETIHGDLLKLACGK